MTNLIQLLPVSSIQIPPVRQRQNVPEDHISNLRDSISENGLIHSILITEGRELIAGYCRLRALQSLTTEYFYGDLKVPSGQVPCLMVSNLSEEELFRLELEENLRRKNLTPAEEAIAISRLHHSLVESHDGDWTRAQTSEEVAELRGESVSPQEIADSLLIAGMADDEDVRKASNRKEAVSIVKKKMQHLFSQALGASAANIKGDLELIEGNLTDVLVGFPDGKYTCIIADPPYGMDASEFGEQSNALGHQYVDTPELALSIAHTIFKEGFRVAKDTSHLWMFCDIRLWPTLKELAREYGWQPFATPIIWDKENVGHAPWPGYFLRRYETILFAQRGNRSLQTQANDILKFPTERDKQHAAQKPVALYRKLIELSCLPGERVLDPCCGRGTIFYAAHETKTKATGIELSPAYASICRQNIATIT